MGVSFMRDSGTFLRVRRISYRMQNVIARISLKQIQTNAALVLQRARVPFIAVVKDDAYGHGAEAVALALQNRVFSFAVATVEEGARLRIAGISREILVLTPPLDEEDALRLKAYSLTASVTSEQSLSLAARAGVPSHVAVNTGMNRYGISPVSARRYARRARDCGLNVTGVYSHFYRAEDAAAREEQFALFCAAAEAVRSVYPDALRHMAATGGLLADEKYRLDAVRSGIALYGYLPRGFEGELAVKPAAKFYARVSNSCARVGGGAAYGLATTERSFHTLRVGYGDGFFRSGGLGGCNELCMDACVREGRERVGDEKLLFNDVTRYATETGTNEYEALVHILQKAVKIYDE